MDIRIRNCFIYYIEEINTIIEIRVIEWGKYLINYHRRKRIINQNFELEKKELYREMV